MNRSVSVPLQKRSASRQGARERYHDNMYRCAVQTALRRSGLEARRARLLKKSEELQKQWAALHREEEDRVALTLEQRPRPLDWQPFVLEKSDASSDDADSSYFTNGSDNSDSSSSEDADEDAASSGDEDDVL